MRYPWDKTMNNIKVPDQNLTVESTLGRTDVVFYDVRKVPFSLHGLYQPQEPGPFRRLPDAVAEATSPGVQALYTNTAGGRVRFATDSPYVAIRVRMPGVCHMSHMPLLGSAGFDLYLDRPAQGDSRYIASFMPPMDMTDGYESIHSFGAPALRYMTIHFPTYSPVSDVQIGVAQGSVLAEGMPYRPLPPIVYYGSSITQGGCVSRPGNTYQSIISRRLRVDHINLGFSGNGRAEPAIVSHMASMSMSAFVSDYDHNAPDADYLRATHERMYRAIRGAHPDIPYVMLSRPDFLFDPTCPERRDVVYETYRRARADGDRKVFYIDGESLFRGPYEDMCTVDGCHPNDLGFALMADAIGAELAREMP